MTLAFCADDIVESAWDGLAPDQVARVYLGLIAQFKARYANLRDVCVEDLAHDCVVAISRAVERGAVDLPSCPDRRARALFSAMLTHGRFMVCKSLRTSRRRFQPVGFGAESELPGWSIECAGRQHEVVAAREALRLVRQVKLTRRQSQILDTILRGLDRPAGAAALGITSSAYGSNCALMRRRLRAAIEEVTP